MRRKKAEEQDATPAEGGRITPAEVQNVEFRLAFRGYNERDVDAFLDRVTEDLSVYLEENQRLRASAAADGGGSATEDARREAAGIVARAREEAAALVRRAEEEAAGLRFAGAATTADLRTALGPFLAREREFLQSLGSLVQGHAEEIREMVSAVRARTEPGAEGPTQQAAAAPTGPAATAPAAPGAGEPTPPDTVVVEDADAQPAYSSESAPSGEGERSLRELFWGED
jgi:DivIVA domain-containing protein